MGRREERDALRTRDRERDREKRERERIMEFRRSQRRMRGALLTTKRARRFVATVARTIQDQAAQGPSSNGTPSPGDAAQAAAKGAAAEAAKKSAKKASGGSLKTWWKQFDKAGRELSAAVVKKAQELKGPAMEMKVNVDVLKPTIDGVKSTVGDFWMKVPPPVQKASPYIGVAALTALTVHTIESRWRKKLATQVAAIEEEKETLKKSLNELENSSRYLRPDSTIDLSRAVSEATAAAASAAAAAAEAARYCVVRR